MRWRKGRRSSNIEDRRGKRALGGTTGKVSGLGLIALVVIGLLTGADPMQIISMVGQNLLSGNNQTTVSAPPKNDETADFVSVVLADTEDVWNPIFKQAGLRYKEPTLVLFTDKVQSACGYSTAATGPFYCPGDDKVYIDLGFFRELEQLGAPGDFAQAYVLGHEVGHHVQNQLGTSRKVSQLQHRSSQRDSNHLSVLLELQADCYAGVWAHHAHKQRNLLEAGDLEEGLQAAASIGDDRLQSMAGQPINPDGFTHGTSKQRMQWFKRGLQTGDMNQCNTFASLR